MPAIFFQGALVGIGGCKEEGDLEVIVWVQHSRRVVALPCGQGLLG